MKIKTLLAALILLSSPFARATLIDLTPGGFDLSQPFPKVVADFFGRYGLGMQNLAAASIVNGQPVWSPFDPFSPPNANVSLNAAGTGANVDWNWLGTGFHGLFVFVESSANIANLYAVRGLERFVGDGTVEVNGRIPIGDVIFTGKMRVPDTGSTLVLMGIGAAALLWMRRPKMV